MKTDDYMDNTPERVEGAKSLVTWFLHSGKTQIHIATANIREARFGIVVIPVNSNLEGQAIDNPNRKQNYGHIMPFDKKNVVAWDVVWSRFKPQGWNSGIVALAVITDNKHVSSSSDRNIHNTSRDVLREGKKCKLGTIGVEINDSYDYTELVHALVDLRNNERPECLSVFLCTNEKHAEVKHFVDKIDALVKEGMKFPRRLVSPEMRGLFPPLKVRTKIQQGSLLDSGCQSVVAAIGHNLKLNKGGVTKEIDEAAGNECQTRLNRIKVPVENWEIIHCPAGKLTEKEIKRLILVFGCIPMWEKTDKNAQMSELLTKFICGCLLKADECGCRSVAIPMLGTGRLKYPERTVLASILDGIELYAQLATLGHIDKIVIAVNAIGSDSFQMYVSELGRRGNKNTKSLCKRKDANILRSTNTINKYTVVNEQHLQEQIPVEFVDVVINNRSGQDVKYPHADKHVLDSFEDGMKLVVDKCETEKNTAIVIHTSRLPTISAETQVEGIISAFERNKNKVYLYKVLIAVSNADDFKKCQNVLWRENSEQGGPKWKQGEGHFVDEVYIINDNESHVTDASKDSSNKDSALVIDMVRAEVNPGITQYLQSIPNVEIWKQKMESVFDLKVFDTNALNGTMMLEGTLENILKAEDYLETDFPNGPELSVAQAIPDQETHLPYSNDGIEVVSETSVRKKTVKESLPDKQTEKAQKYPLNTDNTQGLEYDNRITSTRKTNDGGAGMTTGTSTHQSFVHGNNEMQIKTHNEMIDNASHKTNLQDNDGTRTDKGIAYTFKKMSVYVYQTLITTVSTDTITCTDDINFKHDTGLSRHISSKAGKGCVQKWRPPASELQYCKCIVTPADQLNYQKIIHVIRPENCDDILIAFNNILIQCDKLNISSIAIPTIGAGTWPNKVQDCAEHYYKALQVFSESAAFHTSLTEIHIVDIKKNTIDMVRSVFKRNVSAVPKFQKFSPTDCVPFDVYSSTIAVIKQSMFSFSSDIKVLTTNNDFTEESELMKEALHRCKSFRSWLNGRKREKIECTELGYTQGYDDLRCQHVIVAVHPWIPKPFDKSKKTEFKLYVRKNVKNVMDTVLELHGTTVAIPLVTNSDNAEVNNLCFYAMAEEIISFAQKSDRQRTVYVVTDKANYERFCSVLNERIHPGAQFVRESSV